MYHVLSSVMLCFVITALLILFLINRLIYSQTKDFLSGMVLLYLLLNYFSSKRTNLEDLEIESVTLKV